MDWAYIAGFFDGEGTIGTTSQRHTRIYTYWRLGISQKRRKDVVLDKIREFLQAQGIRCKIKPACGIKCETLDICAKDSIVLFLENCLPYLVVKKDKTELALAHIKSRKWRSSFIPNEIMETAMSLYREGISWREVTLQLGR